MLLDVPYETAQALFVAQGLDRPRKRIAAWSSQVGELEAVLRAAGGVVRRQRFTAWEQLATPVIAKVMVTPRGNWHWVVIDRTPEHGITVLDPWPGSLPSHERPPLGVTCRPLDVYRPQGTCLTWVRA